MAIAARTGRGRREESEWAVLATVALALLVGLILQGVALGRTATATAGTTTLSYPASWTRTSEGEAVFAAADLDRGGVFGARALVHEVPKKALSPRGEALTEAATTWSLSRAQGLPGFRILQIKPTTLHGREAVNVEYAYLAEPPSGSLSGALPGLMRAIDTIVAGADRYHILTFAAESSDFHRHTSAQFPRFRDDHAALLRGWRLP